MLRAAVVNKIVPFGLPYWRLIIAGTVAQSRTRLASRTFREADERARMRKRIDEDIQPENKPIIERASGNDTSFTYSDGISSSFRFSSDINEVVGDFYGILGFQLRAQAVGYLMKTGQLIDGDAGKIHPFDMYDFLLEKDPEMLTKLVDHNLINEAAARATALYAQRLPTKIAHALGRLRLEVVELTIKELVEARGGKYRSPYLKEMMISEFEEEEIKRSFGIKRGGSKPVFDLENLQAGYDKILPIVKVAKSVYKANRQSINWQAHVKTDFPDMDNDLIARLSGKAEDTPAELMTLLCEKGGTSKPSDIALEWAARLCHVPPYHYALKTLKDALTKQKKEKKNSPAQ